MAVAMAVVVAAADPDNMAEAFTIVVMAGFIQVLLGAMRIGRFVAYTPYSVISGFMSGIGVIVMLVHIMPFIGWDVVSGGPLNTLKGLPEALQDINFGAVAIAAVTLAVGIFWPGRLRKFLPPHPGRPRHWDAHGRSLAHQHPHNRRRAHGTAPK